MNGYAIETSGLTKRYGNVEAVTDLTLAVKPQAITGFIGRNGAGKSTTIKMLLGMVRPSAGSGRVLGDNIDVASESVALRRKLAYVGEDKGLYAYLTVGAMIQFMRSFYGDWRPDVEQRLLRMYQLPLERKVKALSKGMRTKLALLLALSRRPELLILDEPTEGLDPVSIEELLQTLSGLGSEGTTIFFSSHQLADVERVADDILMIDRGRIVMDMSLDEMREKYRRITLGFDHQPQPDNFQMPGVERVRCSGRQITVMASSLADEVVARGRSLGAVSVDVAPVSLREVFLETVQGDSQSR
jgi:ABC-2 type transport system ATP-binding protein